MISCGFGFFWAPLSAGGRAGGRRRRRRAVGDRPSGRGRWEGFFLASGALSVLSCQYALKMPAPTWLHGHGHFAPSSFHPLLAAPMAICGRVGVGPASNPPTSIKCRQGPTTLQLQSPCTICCCVSAREPIMRVHADFPQQPSRPPNAIHFWNLPHPHPHSFLPSFHRNPPPNQRNLF